MTQLTGEVKSPYFAELCMKQGKIMPPCLIVLCHRTSTGCHGLLGPVVFSGQFQDRFVADDVKGF